MFIKEKKKLYRNLMKDALAVAKREKNYSHMAIREMSSSKKDLAVAKRLNQPARADDDRQEILIDKAFSQYRMDISKNYKSLAHKYKMKAM